MNKFEINVKPNNGSLPFTYVSVMYENNTLDIAIKIQVNCNNIFFVHDDDNPSNRKYKIIGFHKIVIESDLSKTDHNYLKFCYNRNANLGTGECILIFKIPLSSLTPFNGIYTLKFEGDNKNESTKLHLNKQKGRPFPPPPIETEEGIIIFEPPSEEIKTQ